jgi:hypothetical protein
LKLFAVFDEGPAAVGGQAALEESPVVQPGMAGRTFTYQKQRNS